MLEIYDKRTGSAVDIKTDTYFKDYGVAVNLDGRILLMQYGEVVCGADDRYYGVRLAERQG